MAEQTAVARTPHAPWAVALIVGGALLTLASAVVGYLWLGRVPELAPVDFGEQVEIISTDSASTTIYVSTGLSQAPSCEVTLANGAAVRVGEAERYVQQGGLESAFGFVVPGTTYAVTCASAEPGQFAVAQHLAVPERVFIATGVLGLAACGVGVGLAVGRERSAGRAARRAG
jgi:hypothetical protein